MNKVLFWSGTENEVHQMMPAGDYPEYNTLRF